MSDSIIERAHIDWPDWETRFNSPATEREPSAGAAPPPAEASKFSLAKASIAEVDQRPNDRLREEAEDRAKGNALRRTARDLTLDWPHKECEKTGNDHRFYDAGGGFARCCDCTRKCTISKLDGIAVGPPVGRGRSAQRSYEAGFPITRDWGERVCPYCECRFEVVAANQINCGAADCKKEHVRKVREKPRGFST